MEEQSSSDDDKREAGERAKRQGRLGQKEAALLLSRARLTVNESTEDDEGWDLFVQFPTSLEVTSFLDTAPPAHNCLVQVKTIETADARVRMKLSNALKLAKAPVPSFVLVALVPDDRIEKLWLLHCGAEFV